MHGIGIMLQIAVIMADGGQEVPMLRRFTPSRFILPNGGLPLNPDQVSPDLRQQPSLAGCRIIIIRYGACADRLAAYL